MNRETFIGSIAAICTTISFLPQIVRIYRTKSTRDLSLPMYIVFSFGVAMWLYYGFLTNSFPIILANSVTLALCAYIIFAMMRYNKRKP